MSYRTNKTYLKAVSVIGEKLYKVYQKNLLKYEADIDEAAEKFFKLQIAYHDYILRNKDLELMIPFFRELYTIVNALTKTIQNRRIPRSGINLPCRSRSDLTGCPVGRSPPPGPMRVLYLPTLPLLSTTLPPLFHGLSPLLHILPANVPPQYARSPFCPVP